MAELVVHSAEIPFRGAEVQLENVRETAMSIGLFQHSLARWGNLTAR